MSRSNNKLIIVAVAVMCSHCACFAQDQQEPKNTTTTPATESKKTEQAAKQSSVPPALDTYMGRDIAQTMSHAWADWLTRDRREGDERCSMLLANLGLKQQMTVCDIGCGNGFYTLQIAEMLNNHGQKSLVYAVDVQVKMLDYLRDRMEEKGVENVVPILGSFHNPRLPTNSIDLILLVDVYHEFSHPEHMLTAMKKSLKKDGLIVLVEFRAEDDSVPIKPIHKMSKEQINKEMTANGLMLVKEFDNLPWQHMMFFGKE